MKKLKTKTAAIFYLILAVDHIQKDSDYAGFDSYAQAWIKAATEKNALRMVTRRLADEWRVIEVICSDSVTPGFARLGAMCEPPVFTEEEADEWTEHYWLAQKKGFVCTIGHYDKRRKRRASTKG